MKDRFNKCQTQLRKLSLAAFEMMQNIDSVEGAIFGHDNQARMQIFSMVEALGVLKALSGKKLSYEKHIRYIFFFMASEWPMMGSLATEDHEAHREEIARRVDLIERTSAKQFKNRFFE